MTAAQVQRLAQGIRSSLVPALLKPEYRRRVEAGAHPLTGHCYVASETLYHATGRTLRPQVVRHEGGTHWYLRAQDGTVVDLTAEQFSTPVPYHRGRGCGFLTRRPSQRSQVLLTRLKKTLDTHADGA